MGLASQQAYYLPVAVGDRKAINGIFSATHHYYRRTGIVYLLVTVVFALLYPLCINTVLSYGTVSLIVVVLRHPGHHELSGAGQIPLLYGSGRQKLCDHLHHHGHHGGGQPAAHAGAAVYPQHPVGAGDLLRAFGVPGAGAYGLYAQKLSVAQRARHPQSGRRWPSAARCWCISSQSIVFNNTDTIS